MGGLSFGLGAGLSRRALASTILTLVDGGFSLPAAWTLTGGATIVNGTARATAGGQGWGQDLTIYEGVPYFMSWNTGFYSSGQTRGVFADAAGNVLAATPAWGVGNETVQHILDGPADAAKFRLESVGSPVSMRIDNVVVRRFELAPNKGKPFGVDAPRRCMIMLHGSGHDVAELDDMAAGSVPSPIDVAWFTPESQSSPTARWWSGNPDAVVPIDDPGLAVALYIVEAQVQDLFARGYQPEDIVICGVSQGGYLALEHVARTARPYAMVMAMNAAVMSVVPGNTAAAHASDFTGVNVHISYHDADPQVAPAYSTDSITYFAGKGATVGSTAKPGEFHRIEPSIDYPLMAGFLLSE